MATVCQNTVTQYRPKGYDYVAVEHQCGNTGWYGELLLCKECEHTRKNREANSKADNEWLKSAGWGEI